MEGVVESEKVLTEEDVLRKPNKTLAIFEDTHTEFRQFLLDNKIHSADAGVKILLCEHRQMNGKS